MSSPQQQASKVAAVRARRSIVVLSPGGGHAQRLLPLVADLVKRGFDVHVMTRPDVRDHVEAAGGVFCDLFATYPVNPSIAIRFRFRLAS